MQGAFAQRHLVPADSLQAWIGSLSLGGGEPPMVGVATLNTPADPIVSVEVWVQGPNEAEATSWMTIPVTADGEFANAHDVGTSPEEAEAVSVTDRN